MLYRGSPDRLGLYTPGSLEFLILPLGISQEIILGMASPPFEYEDLLSKSIKFLEDKNNRTDPTGKLNELRLPPKRRQQAAALPKFDHVEQQ